MDNAYIFTNIWSFETKQDTYNPNRVKTEWAKMREPYNKLNVWGQTELKSFYRSRQGDYNSADSRFNAFFIKSFMKFFDFEDKDKYPLKDALKDRFELKGMKLDINVGDVVMEETKIGVDSANSDHSVSGYLAKVQMAETDIQAQFNAIIRENLSGLAYIRSRSPINSAILDAFGTFYNVFTRKDRVSSIMIIVVNNKNIFAEILSEATRDFREMISAEAFKKGDTYDFKIDESRPYSIETHTELPGATKSLYQPLYVLKDDQGNPDNGLEKDFLLYLNQQNMVRWYWENGTELMRINFGIPYNNGMNTFQPDFIVKFENGSVGIFDTKPINHRVEDTTIKANALSKYLDSINCDRGYAPKVFGGIVVKSGSQFYAYLGHNYHDYESDHNGWVNFNEVLRKIDDEVNIQKYLKTNKTNND